ncbi:hypothetical protein KEM54_006366 [Ascosphaera aggregata]|nr:hypothetical protein KEM54_006366 [Ascosphaera aggregata]
MPASLSTSSSSLLSLTNPLVSPLHLTHSSSLLDGIPSDIQSSIRYAATRLTQAAGILLDLPQDVIAHAIVLFTRFWMRPDGGSLAVYSAKDISAASIYLSAKLSFQPRSPRSVLNVYAYLLSPAASPLDFVNPINATRSRREEPDPSEYYLSEGTLQSERLNLVKHETLLLRHLGFNTHVTLPYAITLTYLQTMQLLKETPHLSTRVIAHLNTALLSPQLVFLTHQPNALAVAAIYLAARELGVKLVDGNWWEVFDVDREELGFLVVAMRSMEGFARKEFEDWVGKGIPVPLTVTQLEVVLKERETTETNIEKMQGEGVAAGAG